MDAQAATPSTPTNGANGAETPAKTETNGAVAATSIPQSKPVGQKAPNEGVDGGEQPAQEPTEAEKAAKAAEGYRFRKELNVYGKKMPVDLDEQALERYVQKGLAFDQRSQKLKQAEERLAQTIEMGKKDPVRAFKELFGSDFREAAIRELAREAERRAQLAGLSPEQQKLLEDRQKFEEERLQWKSEREEHEKKAKEEFANRIWKERLEPEYMGAIQEMNLPKDPVVFETIAALGQGFEDAKLPLSPKQIVAEANERLQRLTSHYVLALDPKGLDRLLGRERVDALIKLRIEAAKAKGTQTAAPVRPAEPQPQERQWISETDFKRWLDGR